MVEAVLNILFIIHGGLFIGLNIYFLIKGYRHSILYLYPILFWFNILPSLIHVFAGIPDYSYWVNISLSANDIVANMIYKIFIIIVSLVMWVPYLLDKTKTKEEKKYVNEKMANYMLFLQVLPLVYIILTPKYWGNFTAYGARYLDDSIPEIPNYLLSLSSLAFGFYWLNNDFKFVKRNIISVILLIIAIYLRGSRAIIMNSAIIFCYAILISGKVSFKRIFPFLLVGCIVSLVFLYSYHLLFRTSDQSFYTYYSIDLSRDYSVIYSIYSQINDIQILAYPLQGFIFCVLFWLPRALAPWKPYPYSSYLSASLLGRSIEDVPALGVRTTTNIFSQVVSDCGIFLGILFSALLMYVLCRIIDRSNSINLKYFLLYISFELLTMDFAYWAIEIVLFLVYILIIKLYKKYGNQIQSQFSKCLKR